MLRTHPRRHSVPLHKYGGVRLRAVIILITLCILGFTIYHLLHSLGQNQQVDHRKALAISEYGLMVALQQPPESRSFPSATARTDYDGGWYKVSSEKKLRNDTLYCTISSKGHFGSATEIRECILRLEVNGNDSQWVRKSMH